MKKLFVILGILFSGFVNAQTIGDHLNTVMEAKPGGTVDPNKPYTYSVNETSVESLMMYFFDENLICIKLVIAPQTSLTRQKWAASFNDNWISLNSTEWRFYREDGMVLRNSMEYVKDVGTVFFIREEKVLN